MRINDIAIIGLGPAGSTVARLLGNKYQIVAFDKKSNENIKCCGGLLSPDAQKILAKFDLCLPTSLLVNPQIFSVKVLDFDNDIESYYQRFYLNMDRGKFDKWLISLIPNKVKILTNSFCQKIIQEKDYYKIEYTKENKKYIEFAKVIIGADGANSLVRNSFYNNKIKPYISIQEWYKNNNISSSYTSIFDKSLTKSYCWTISKDDYFIVGGAFLQKNGHQAFESLKNKLKNKGFIFDKKIKTEACLVNFSKEICVGKNNIFLIGEASGMISSSSLEGISYAMESANILSNILKKQLLDNGNRFKYKTLKLRIKLNIKHIKRLFMYNKYLRKMIIKSRIQAINKYEL